MSEKSNFHVELPENLKGKFKSLGRKLLLVDTIIAVSGIAGAVMLFYLLLFITDRFWDTSAGLRLLYTAAGLGVSAWFAWFWINHWIVNRRDNRVLAAIVQQKHRRMGDRLMSAVELTDHDERPENVSETLCRAAIEQIANESESYSFNQAVATRKPFIYTVLTMMLVGLLSLPLIYTRAASVSTAKRANPFSQESRYTFVENGGLEVNGKQHMKDTFYVARGEEITLTSKYAFADTEDGQPFWETLGELYENTEGTLADWDKSLKGTLDIGLADSFTGMVGDPSRAELTGLKKPVFAMMKDGRVEYTLPGRSNPFDLTLRVGDARRTVRIQPVSRPELDDTTAVVRYPKYLQYPETVEGVRGTVFPYLEGSMVKFRGQVQDGGDRSLTEVIARATRAIGSEVQNQKTIIKSDILETAFLDLDEFEEMEITWSDQYQIAGAASWKLMFERRSDQLPHRVEAVLWMDGKTLHAPEVGILRSQVVEIPMVGEDDYGMRELAVEWFCWKRDGTNLVKRSLNRQTKKPGTDRLASFKPQTKTGSATFLFDPGDNAMNIPEGTVVDVYAVASDYYLNDRSARSLPVRIHILTKEEHAQLIQQNFESKMAELDDLVRREENLEDATRETGEMKPEDMKTEQTDKQIARQEQEQKDIADKLKELAKDIEELAKEALKNPEMDPTDLAKMAEIAKKMKEAAAKEMAAAKAALKLAMENKQDRKENLDDAEKKEKEAKEKLQELQENAEETAQAMYANTLVKRLRKIAKFEEGVAKDFKENTGKLIGQFLESLPDELRKMVNDAYGYQGVYSRKAARLQEEIAAFYDATNNEKFGKVTSDMANYKPAEKMEDAAKHILKNHMTATIESTTEIAKKFNEWADIIDPQEDSEPGEGEGEPGEPNEDLIARLKELLRLRQAEMDLRENTLRLDAEAGIKDRDKLEDDAFGLQFRQLELLGDLQKERDERGDGEFLPAAQFRMRDAEDELNLQGDEEGLEEAYKWALVSKAKKGGEKIDATLKALRAKLTDKQRQRAAAKAKAIQDSDK